MNGVGESVNSGKILYEAHFERDFGIALNLHAGGSNPQPWSGWRVRYRPLGTRRWTRFVTDSDLDNLSVPEIQALCRAHAELKAASS